LISEICPEAFSNNKINQPDYVTAKNGLIKPALKNRNAQDSATHFAENYKIGPFDKM